MDYAKIDENLKAGHLSALAVTAVDYQTSHSVTFVHGRDDLPTWNKASRLSEKADIRSEHIMASAAIPLLFPPVKVDERWFGDGCVRNAHPCAPSIYMGAEKLIVVGVRHQEKLYSQTIPESEKAPSVARVINVLLNAVLLDGIELDVERMDRINELVKKLPHELLGTITYKPIDSFWIAPSADLGEIAARKSSRLPRIIRYLIKGLGSLDEAREVVSYLLFDPSYCSQLIDIGYEDAMKQQDTFLKFYESE